MVFCSLSQGYPASNGFRGPRTIPGCAWGSPKRSQESPAQRDGSCFLTRHLPRASGGLKRPQSSPGLSRPQGSPTWRGSSCCPLRNLTWVSRQLRGAPWMVSDGPGRSRMDTEGFGQPRVTSRDLGPPRAASGEFGLPRSTSGRPRPIPGGGQHVGSRQGPRSSNTAFPGVSWLPALPPSSWVPWAPLASTGSPPVASQALAMIAARDNRGQLGKAASGPSDVPPRYTGALPAAPTTPAAPATPKTPREPAP